MKRESCRANRQRMEERELQSKQAEGERERVANRQREEGRELQSKQTEG